MSTQDKWDASVAWASETKKNIKEGKVETNVTLLYLAAIFVLITVIIFVSTLIYKRMNTEKNVKEMRNEITTAIPCKSVETDVCPTMSKNNPSLQQKLAEVDFVVPNKQTVSGPC